MPLGNLDIIDNKTRDKIIETHTNVRHIIKDLESGNEKFNRIESRLNRIEQLFFPVVLIISAIAHKALNWLKL